MRVCKGCAFEYEWKQGDPHVPVECIDCQVMDGKPTNFKPKPMTNADRIRAMSDEELATLLSELCWNGEHCYSCPFDGKSCGGINGLSGWLDWAKRPAEVDNG